MPAVKPRVRDSIRVEPLVGLIRNPFSHGNERAVHNDIARTNVLVASPSSRSQLPEILAGFAEKGVDYIAIDGGDGTVRDVLTCGVSSFGDDWPTLIILPRGKTNALAHDLGISPNWTIDEALEAARRETAVIRRPLVVAQHGDTERAQVWGFVLGAGAYTPATNLGQAAHNFGAFNAVVVGVTVFFSLFQMLFGRPGNVWRRGTRMQLRDAEGNELPHAGGGARDERYLVFASTLETLPAGLRPFKGIDAPLRLGVVDNSRRRLLLRLPAMLFGHIGKASQRLGAKAHGLEAFDLDISDKFILDGEAFPRGSYRVFSGPRLRFIVP